MAPDDLDPDTSDQPRVVAGDRDALDVALRRAADEGWRPGRHDATAFAAQDPAGLLSVRRGRAVVSTLAAVRYGDAFGFLGLYITDPDERGHGLGTALSQAGLAHVSGLPCVGLDGVVEREGLYASLGFRAAHLSRRWSASNPAPGPGPRRSSAELVDACAVGAPGLGAYEQRVRAFPAPRQPFLEAWLGLPESFGRAALGADGAVVGYGVVRRCTTGAKVAPLFADDPGVAADLLDDLLALGADWGEVSLDVPDPNGRGVALARERGMSPGFACVRMYSGADAGLDTDRVFGLTSFELG